MKYLREWNGERNEAVAGMRKGPHWAGRKLCRVAWREAETIAKRGYERQPGPLKSYYMR